MSNPHEQDLLALGQAVRWLRQQRCMGTEELAEAAGVKRQCISTLEAGRLDPTYDLLLAIAEGLGIGLSALVTHAEER